MCQILQVQYTLHYQNIAVDKTISFIELAISYYFFIGMINIQGLKDVITNQQIKYDFTYYSIDYETQIPVLILSEGKSLFPVS